MADIDPNSNITTTFKQSARPEEKVRNVSQADQQEANRVRNAIRKGTNAKMPSLNKAKNKRSTRK